MRFFKTSCCSDIHTNVLFYLCTDTRPVNGCPEATKSCDAPECMATCFCEDHCSFEKCKFDDPPKRCLDGTTGKWHTASSYWIATFEGINILPILYICIYVLRVMCFTLFTFCNIFLY